MFSEKEHIYICPLQFAICTEKGTWNHYVSVVCCLWHDFNLGSEIDVPFDAHMWHPQFRATPQKVEEQCGEPNGMIPLSAQVSASRFGSEVRRLVLRAFTEECLGFLQRLGVEDG